MLPLDAVRPRCGACRSASRVGGGCQTDAMRYRALITGASAGLGAAFARRLAALGVDLVVVARDEGRLRALAAQLPVDVEVLAADLLDPADLERVERRLRSHDAPIDILVNNAGFAVAEPFESSALGDERRMLELLATVPMRLAHAAIGPMRERRRGWILNVASMAAFMPSGTYGAAKAYLLAFSRSLRVRFRRDGIHVTALCPGYVHTEFHERMGTGEQAPAWMWADADTVVAEGIRGLRRGVAIVRSDARYRALTPLLTLLPDRAQWALFR